MSRRRAMSNIATAAGIIGVCTAVGVGYAGLTVKMHNHQMRKNYEEERRIAMEAYKLGTITQQEFQNLYCNQPSSLTGIQSNNSTSANSTKFK
ncbi:hypothetical protein AAMO2058_000325300 [Amorphochlora amoebiformis]